MSTVTMLSNIFYIHVLIGTAVAFRLGAEERASLDSEGGRGLLQVHRHLEEGLKLSSQFEWLAAALPEENATRTMFQSFRICGHCEHFERYGESNDGGYLTCMDTMPSTVAAISVGVEAHDQWSLDTAAKHGIHVSQFDCTVDQGTSCNGGCSFYKQCLVSADNHEAAELQPTITLSAVAKVATPPNLTVADRSLLMKMDCEGCEWPVFEVESAGVLKQFNQIILEFHWLSKAQNHVMYAKAMTNLLQQGFRVVHIHGNNCDGMYKPFPDQDMQIPDVLEVTLVADGAASTQACLADQQYLELDAPNKPNKKELPMAKLGLAKSSQPAAYLRPLVMALVTAPLACL